MPTPTNQNSDAPAYPHSVTHYGTNTFGQSVERVTETHSGLSKREYFAAMAMQGLLADSATETSVEVTAAMAVHQADALLAALAKERPTP